MEAHAQLNTFLDLMDLEWNIKISSNNALASLHDKKINAVELLPLTEDLVKLNNFLNSELQKAKKELSVTKAISDWSYFASVTLSKRRSGEASRLTMVKYSSRPNWTQAGTEEFRNSLSPLELQLAANLTLVQIKGKRQRIVNILLTNDVKEAIDLLIKYREEGRWGSRGAWKRSVLAIYDNPYRHSLHQLAAVDAATVECQYRFIGEGDVRSACQA
ncbi:hypothetical protein NQ315_008748 [Exocentrus adspersus]|uniref:Uncharacterized protein n=1 Tax=Exocentrus adspersus TaxID=1586481 RepID=A0AAV8VGN8_9CUCU|nr:hypothetical protein NQ315_008748 [Exocentrus adspersus]